MPVSAHRGCSLFARILDTGFHNGIPYTVSELCDFSLMNVISMRILHPLPRRHLREIAMQLVRGLECESTCTELNEKLLISDEVLHSLGIVHTDIKPTGIALRSGDMVTMRRMRRDGFFENKVSRSPSRISQSRLIASWSGRTTDLLAIHHRLR